jgi:NCAIR mutase (PurE)-related protein
LIEGNNVLICSVEPRQKATHILMEAKSMDQQNEEQKSQASNPTPNATKGTDGKELIDELTLLGQKFVEVVEAAWNSDERRKIEKDLRTGLVSVASSLEDGIKRVSNSKEAKDAVNAAEDVADKVLKSKIAAELSDVLADGLRSLSTQMDKLAKEMKQKSSSMAEQAADRVDDVVSETQDIPIVEEAKKAAREVGREAEKATKDVENAASEGWQEVEKAAEEAKKAADETFSETQS